MLSSRAFPRYVYISTYIQIAIGWSGFPRAAVVPESVLIQNPRKIDKIDDKWTNWLKVASSCPQVGSSWPHVGSSWLKLASCWLKLASCWLKLASSWPKMASCCLKLTPICLKLSQFCLKLASSWVKGQFWRQVGAAATCKKPIKTNGFYMFFQVPVVPTCLHEANMRPT